jgi:hypothetical protein
LDHFSPLFLTPSLSLSPPIPSLPGRNCFALISNFVQQYIKQKKIESIPSKVRNDSLHSYSNILLEFLTKAIRQEKEIKGKQRRKEEVKLFILTNDMILHLKEVKNSTKNPS